MADYYEILGVGRAADEKEIRQAYRRLARQHHPDVNPGDDGAAERFKSINAAYEVLSDADKRARYDRYGDRWEHAGQFEQAAHFGGGAGPGGGGFTQFFRMRDFGDGGGRGGFTFTSGGGPGATLSDLLSGLGGVASGIGDRLRPQPAADVPVDITLEEADAGATRMVNLHDGRRLEVKIPPGIADGGRVHIGAGSSSSSDGPGQGQGQDFNLLVSVQPHPGFERDGDDLHTTVDVPLTDAVLGGAAIVKTLRGQIELTLPPETQNGRRFRLAGQGMSRLSDPARRGNLYATVNVTLPVNLNQRQRRLFEELRDADADAGNDDDDGDDGAAQRTTG